MKLNLIFVLLFAASMAFAGEKTKTESSSNAADTEKETEAAQLTKQAQPETDVAMEQSEDVQANSDGDAKLVSVPGGKALGMSILGNQDAPKSLVIVPWKSSELGNTPGVSTMLDDSRQPVDKEVFMRALRYYEIRSGTKKK